MGIFKQGTVVMVLEGDCPTDHTAESAALTHRALDWIGNIARQAVLVSLAWHIRSLGRPAPLGAMRNHCGCSRLHRNWRAAHSNSRLYSARAGARLPSVSGGMSQLRICSSVAPRL